MFFNAFMSAGFSLLFTGAVGFPRSLFRSNLSAFKLNLMICFLKPVTSTSPASLVSAMFKLNLLLAVSFLILACAPKLNVPFMPPLGRLGSLMSKLPTSFGISKIKS